ncbi:hypothetical protein E2C01_018576 [Portunus trituberculatus]|uniref:Uncharacterized protein n=1 Tax=Portunus trituberculatus TaxID=210409 RepID=A0A5B7DVD9_PORTR|nr:hypothetical protein [Portunus trituberculatus]
MKKSLPADGVWGGEIWGCVLACVALASLACGSVTVLHSEANILEELLAPCLVLNEAATGHLSPVAHSQLHPGSHSASLAWAAKCCLFVRCVHAGAGPWEHLSLVRQVLLTTSMSCDVEN